MRERWTDARAVAFACLLLALAGGAPASAQQGGPPPAVLVQPAELKPIATQAEFIGRAAAAVEEHDGRTAAGIIYVHGAEGPRSSAASNSPRGRSFVQSALACSVDVHAS